MATESQQTISKNTPPDIQQVKNSRISQKLMLIIIFPLAVLVFYETFVAMQQREEKLKEHLKTALHAQKVSGDAYHKENAESYMPSFIQEADWRVSSGAMAASPCATELRSPAPVRKA